MLFPRLEGQYERAFPIKIGRSAHNPAGQFAHQFHAAGKEANVRSSETEGYAERLGISAGDVRTPFPRGLQDSQRRWVAIHGQQGSSRMRRICKSCKIFDYSVSVDSRHEHPCHIVPGQLQLQITNGSDPIGNLYGVKLHSVISGICPDYIDNIRKQGRRYQHLLPFLR